ncbi:MAG: DUF3667 domain-containing protein [Rubrivivax sp.]|nr:DUF3667 domain-containing protein [Rubrivivax sp.]
MWRTLKLLLLKPGELTRQYLDGRRKHYVLPLRLYLTISVVVLLALRLVGSGVNVSLKGDADAPGAAPSVKNLNLQLFGGRAGMKDGVFYCSELPAWMCRRLQARIAVDDGRLQESADALKDRFIANLGPGMFLLLPTFALWMKLVYWNRRLRYTEHLVFALHLHAFWFLALALTLPDIGWLSGCTFVAVPIYTFMAMKRVYGGRLLPRLARGALVTLLYAVTMAFALVGVGLAALLG